MQRPISVVRSYLTPLRVVSGAVAIVLAGGVLAAAALPAVPGAVAAGLPGSPADQMALPQGAAAQPVTGAPLELMGTLPAGPAAPVGSAAPAVRPVAPLVALRATDLVVTVRRPLSAPQISALQAVRKLEALTVVDAGTVRVHGKGARIVGVDPSQFRAFTPSETAASDALWQAVARGELAPSYALTRSRGLRLGTDLVIAGVSDRTGRVGAIAAYGLPGVDLVTDRATARSLGVVPSSAVLVSAPGRSIGALRREIRAIVGADAVVDVLRVQVAAAQRSGRPRTYRDLYLDGARYCPGLSWTILAGIGQVESGHGRNNGPSSAGALGPMQFLPSTWAAYGLDGDRDGQANINSPYDAIPSAAGYLCRFGANQGPDGLYDAIFAYNHADWYVKKVLATAALYR